MDVKATIEIMGDDGAGETTEVVSEIAQLHDSLASFKETSIVLGVNLNAISSKGALNLSGVNIGCWLQDYCTANACRGALLQGRIIKMKLSNFTNEVARATCWLDEVLLSVSRPLNFYAPGI